MKKITILALAGLLALYSCDQTLAPSEQALERTKENTTLFQDADVTDANPSVQAFGEAMEAFEKGDRETVANDLKRGIDALANEGKFLEGTARTNMERAIRQLEELRSDFTAGKVVSVDQMMAAISQAELDVPHKLLEGYDEVEVAPEE